VTAAPGTKPWGTPIRQSTRRSTKRTCHQTVISVILLALQGNKKVDTSVYFSVE